MFSFRFLVISLFSFFCISMFCQAESHEGKTYLPADRIEVTKYGIYLSTEKGIQLITHLSCDAIGLFLTEEEDRFMPNKEEQKVYISPDEITIEPGFIIRETERGVGIIPQLSCDLKGLYIPAPDASL